MHDPTNEAAAWEAAVKMASEHGNTLALARLDRIGVPGVASLDVPGEHDLIGSSEPLPKGGDTYETAFALQPGFYKCTIDCSKWWYKVYMRGGQRLDVKFRSPVSGGLAELALYGTNGQALKAAGDSLNEMRGNAGPGGTIYRLTFDVIQEGWYFMMTKAEPQTVYRLHIG
jgi:hypothetical protein